MPIKVKSVPFGHPYSATILSSSADIGQLDSSIRLLIPDRDTTLDPRFFLASISSQWIPRVAVVRRGDVLAGIIYGKERRIAGMPTGIIYIDGRLGNMVVARPGEEEQVIRVGLHALLARPRILGVRLAIPPAGVEARATAGAHSFAGVDVAYSSAGLDAHALLPLTADYQEFLQGLRRATRQNFRRYRRKFAEGEHSYVQELSPLDVRHAVADLSSKSHIPCPPRDIERALGVLAAAAHTWAVGLRHRNGQWVSVAAGWYSADRAIMFLQLNNDREHGSESPSVVLRSHLIETLIGQKIRELVFWAGSSPPLMRYTTQISAMRVHLDVPTPVWRLIRSLIARTQPHVAKWIGWDLSWIACAGASLEPPGADPQMHVPARPLVES